MGILLDDEHVLEPRLGKSEGEPTAAGEEFNAPHRESPLSGWRQHEDRLARTPKSRGSASRVHEVSLACGGLARDSPRASASRNPIATSGDDRGRNDADARNNRARRSRVDDRGTPRRAAREPSGPTWRSSVV